MRNGVLKSLALFVIVISICSSSVHAQIAVTVRPIPPAFARPYSPSPRHTWIDGEWIWRRGRYEYSNGYWTLPPRYGAVWVPGHWKRSFRGWIWKPGHWRRW